MIMKQVLGILLIMLTTSLGIFAQEDLSKEEVELYTQMTHQAAGTYQFQMVNTRDLPTVPLSIIKQIEENRDVNEVVYYQYSEKMRIMILPKNTIKAEGFIPIESIKYVSI